ncbi:hypothetical protein EUTSA_v10008449mg [Eutrema salsugineum]|uniref:Uncharacterized protein n=1 Tax=Eutrema salsugineum TaxID=72664 RepID=V4KF43_EUTSA|nr:hypothetical protein EUTSA_v10008449mg [Eutrema salsugineum]
MALTALNDLYYVLATKPEQEKITPEESSVIVSCHLKLLWTAGFASGVGAGLGWQVAKRLKMMRLSITGAAMAAFAFAWDRASSTTAVSCLDHILRQDATRMQKELVNVLIRSNRGEDWRWQLMCKHFYPEAIYSDQGDKPRLHWRRRSTFTEIASSYDDDVNEAKPQRTYNGLPNPRSRSTSHGSDASKTEPVLQNSSGNSGGEMVEEEDALDFVFGDSEPTESSSTGAKAASLNLKASGKTQTRKQKRALRRQRRLKNREASTNNTPQYELA